MLRLILWLPFFCLPALAQNVTGSITGAVVDKSGSQIPAVNVKLTSEATAATREAATDPSGNFHFNAIQGRQLYSIRQHPGFKGYEKKNIQLTPNESISLGAIHLDLGEITESVVVSADIATVQIASGERSGIITIVETTLSVWIPSRLSESSPALPGGIRAQAGGQHHGGHWYYRHEWMNANDFFNNRNGVAPTPRRVQTPGGNIGGPIYL